MPTRKPSRALRPSAPFEFTLIVQGPDVLLDENLDALFEAGCDDALFGATDGVQHADFARRAHSFATAVESAILDMESALPGLLVARVEQDDWITAAEIAAKVGRSRESVRLLVEGERGPGGFPAPVSHASRRRIWRWADVAAWCEEALGERPAASEHSTFVAALNGVLETRLHAGRRLGADARRVIANIAREDAALYSTRRP